MVLGNAYRGGLYGLPQNNKKGEDLYQEAYDLDDPFAAFYLFRLYSRHYPDQKEKQMEFLRRGKTLGNLRCIETFLEEAATMVPPNYKEAIRLIMKAASLWGYIQSYDMLSKRRHFERRA